MSTKSFLPYKSGFTILELLITVSIMLLLVSGGLVTYLRFNDRQILENSVKELKGHLRNAQVKARLGDRPTGCTKLDGYKVSMQTGSPVVTLEAVCAEGDIERNIFDLEPSVSPDADFDITFYVLHGGVDEVETITLTSATGLVYEFQVTAGGQITEGGLVE